MKLKVQKCEGVLGMVNISGSKNTALPIIAACLLTKKTITLKNIPLITDVLLMLEIIKSMGVQVIKDQNTVKIKAKSFSPIINSKDVCKLRGSYYLIGAALTRYNMCSIKMPGGCNFSSRPIDLHVKAFEELGFKTSLSKTTLYVKQNQQPNSEIVFEKKTVGATINAILASSLMNKEITIINPSLEPEVLETIIFLKKLGIDIEVVNNKILIKGYDSIRSITHTIVSDRIEAGSYMLLAASIPHSNLQIKNVPVKYMKSVFDVLEMIGCKIYQNKNDVRIDSNDVKKIKLEINEYPSFPTDLQQILTVVLLTASKTSYIKDNIYPSRTSHIAELNKMNGKIEKIKDYIQVKSSKLVGTNVIAKDLRACFALIVAGSIAENETIIDNADILFRGYEKPLIKLNKIGIKISEYICKS